MTWFIWQQQRRQVVVVAAALGLAAAFLLVSGLHLAGTYHSALRTCAASPLGCAGLSETLFQGDNRLFDIVDGVGFLLPFVLGVFWGAPLLTREIEEGTHRLAWTQGTTRLRWLSAKLAWAGVAAALVTGALSALMTWWYSPVDAVQTNRFGSVIFDTQGVVPVAYAVFGVALGALAGAVVRRTVLAMAVTLGGLGVLRYVVDEYVRPHLLAARTLVVSMGAALNGAPAGAGSWTLGSTYLNPSGRAIPTPGGKIDPSTIPAACRQVFYSDDRLSQCLSTHGYRAFLTYQPANRFWVFQGIEAALFIAAAALAVAATCWWVVRGDA